MIVLFSFYPYRNLPSSALYLSTISPPSYSASAIILINYDRLIIHSSFDCSIYFSFIITGRLCSCGFVCVLLLLFLLHSLFYFPVLIICTVDSLPNVSFIFSQPFNVWLSWINICSSCLSIYRLAIMLFIDRFLLINISCLLSVPFMNILYISDSFVKFNGYFNSLFLICYFSCSISLVRPLCSAVIMTILLYLYSVSTILFYSLLFAYHF